MNQVTIDRKEILEVLQSITHAVENGDNLKIGIVLGQVLITLKNWTNEDRTTEKGLSG